MTELLDKLSSLGFVYGPFFFALLFILFITRKAQLSYRSICERSKPPPSREEMKTYQIYFYTSLTAGIVIVFVAIGWWIFQQYERNHILAGQILGFETDQVVTTRDPDIFLRSNLTKDSPYVTLQYVVMKEKPISPGKSFNLEFNPYFKPGGAAIIGTNPGIQILKITYLGFDRQNFELTRNGDKWDLKPVE